GPDLATGKYEWRPEETHQLWASVASVDCGGTVTWQFSKTGVAVPSPVVVGNQATFDLTGLGCVGADGTLTVGALDPAYGTPVETTYDVHIADLVEAPVVSLTPPELDVQVPPGQSSTITVTATHCSGNGVGDFTYSWSCDATTGNSVTLSNPGTDACGSSFACSVTVTARASGGHPPEIIPFAVTMQPTSSAPAVSLSSTDVRVAPGALVTVTATAQNLCSPTYSISCPMGFVPQPQFAAAGQWSFQNPAPSCGASADCVVSATGSDGRSVTAEVHVTLEAEPHPTNVSLDLPTAPIELQAGDSLTVTASASANPCSADLAWTWDCDPAQPVLGTDVARTFSHPGRTCGDQEVTCVVVASPNLGGADGTAQFSFTLLGSPDTSMEVRYSSQVPVRIAEGGSERVEVVAGSVCSTQFTWSWDCSDGTQPDSTGAVAHFQHRGDNCSDEPVSCAVAAYPVGAGERGDALVQVTYAAIQPETQITVPPAESLVVPESQAFLDIEVTAENRCSTTFTWEWACDDSLQRTGDQVRFVRPTDNCEAKSVTCQVSAAPEQGSGSAKTESLQVSYPPVQGILPIAWDLPAQVENGVLSASATAQGLCPDHATFDWRVLSSNGLEIARYEDTRSIAHRADSCSSATVTIEGMERASGDRASRPDIPMEVVAGALEIADLAFTPELVPDEEDSSNPPGFEVECGAPRALSASGLVQKTHDCRTLEEWSQLAGPPFELGMPPGDLAGLYGSTIEYLLRVTDSADRQDEKAFRFRVLPDRFVLLEHRADRRNAGVGEPIRFEVGVSTTCVAPMAHVIDLSLSLSGLDYVRGSAELDGAAIGDPEHHGARWVFRALSTPGREEPGRVLSYSARRRSGSSGSASSMVEALLSADPSLRVSREGTRHGGSGDGVPVASCQCSQVRGAEPWLGLLLLAVQAVRRRRRWTC
ncbi:MAG: hypothetical protein HY901_19470, partial [Deltaproteobacteria bacterium]|nr:hypothetical protein [Deltaproteobacteria bacterium]